MRKFAIFTMDVEDVTDSFCVKEQGTNVSMMDGFSLYLDLLDKYEIKGTFFALASRIEKDKDILLEAIKRGHKIALHGNTHDKVSEMNVEDFKKEIIKGKSQLEEALGVTIKGYRAPGFSIRQEEIDSLSELGFSYDSSIQDYSLSNYGADYDLSSYTEVFDSVYKKDDFYAVKMTLSTGHPLNGLPIGGGGYLRMPPKLFISRVLRKTLKDRHLYIFYCHPFEVSSKRAPNFKGISPLGWAYLRRGRGKSFVRRIEKTIKALKKEGYEFVSFDELIKNVA
ncbi:MAG: polysaccharide deacetylase family protein [Bacilli bacterium]|nr:polysaccharide deacetylase family protein [Bacilli bacterium]